MPLSLVDSLKPTAAGVIICVAAASVTTSAITPLPGSGSVLIVLDESDDLAEDDEYTVTQAALSVCTERRAYELYPVTDMSSEASLAIELVVADVDTLFCKPVAPP